MRKLLALLVVFALSVAVLPTGAQEMDFDCGTDQEVVLQFISGTVGGEHEATVAVVENYADVCPNVVVNVLTRPTSTTETLAQYQQFFEAQSGAVDVYMLDVFFPAIVAEHLVDLTPFVDQAFLDQYYPALIEANTVGGQLLALPWFAGAGMLYYRTDLLEKYGYDAPPATWAELTEMAQAIQDGERAEGNPDFWGFVWQGNAYEGLTCDALEWQKSFGGGVIINPDGVIEVNNPETIEAFDLAAGWVGTITPEAVLSYQEEDARAVWHAGNAAFMRNWGYAYTLSQADDSAVAGNFSVVPLPGSEPGMGAATLGGWQLGVTKYSSNIDAAVAFVKWMVSYDQLKVYHLLRGEQPVMPALYQDAELVEALPYLADMGNILNFATARPAVAGAQYNDVSQLYYTAVHSILEGQADAATAMADLELALADLGFELP